MVQDSEPNDKHESPKKQLTLHDMEDMAGKVIHDAEAFVPGRTTEEKKTWCINRLMEVLEMFDNYIPVIGMLLDFPVIDDFERQAVTLLVDWAWTKHKRESDKPVTCKQENTQAQGT